MSRYQDSINVLMIVTPCVVNVSSGSILLRKALHIEKGRRDGTMTSLRRLHQRTLVIVVNQQQRYATIVFTAIRIDLLDLKSSR